MDIVKLIIIALTLLAILWTVRSCLAFHREAPTGTVLYRRAVPVAARLKMLIPSLTLTVLVVAPSVALGVLPWGWGLVSALVIAAVLALPMYLTLTTDGIAVGWKGFHRWTEFAGVRRTAAGVTLQWVRGNRGLTLWLIGERGEDQLIHHIRVLIRAAYTGRTNGADDQSASVTDELSPISPAALTSATQGA